MKTQLNIKNNDLRSKLNNAVLLRTEGTSNKAEFEYLMKMARDESAKVRSSAIRAIGLINEHPELSVPVLNKALFDSDPQVKQYAAAALGLFSVIDLLNYESVDCLKIAIIDADRISFEFISETLMKIEQETSVCLL